MDNSKYKIGIVCDFFYPGQGGVEVHIYQLALALIRKKCKVIVFTHNYKDRQGIRYMGNGLKVFLKNKQGLLHSKSNNANRTRHITSNVYKYTNIQRDSYIRRIKYRPFSSGTIINN